MRELIHEIKGEKGKHKKSKESKEHWKAPTRIAAKKGADEKECEFENRDKLKEIIGKDGDLSFDANRFRRVILEKNVLFDFIDNGPGIPEEIQETLFEVFVTKGKEKGTGLAMSTVKSIKFLVSLPMEKWVEKVSYIAWD